MIINSALLSTSSELERGSIFPPFLNFIFLMRKILVCLLFSGYLVSRYSHERTAKNNLKIKRCVTATSQGVVDNSFIFLNTDAGSAFCFFVFPSVFLYPLHCSCKRKHVLPSRSSLGSSLSLDLKACATYEMVVSTVPWTRFVLYPGLKVASRTAWANVENKIFFWNLENPSRKIDCLIPTVIRNVFQQRQVADRFVFVSLTDASTRATAAELIQ